MTIITDCLTEIAKTDEKYVMNIIINLFIFCPCLSQKSKYRNGKKRRKKKGKILLKNTKNWAVLG